MGTTCSRDWDRQLLLTWTMILGIVFFSPLALADALDRQHSLSMDFETPHTDWAQPYTGQSTSILYFSSPRDTRARHIVELMQRFEVDADCVYWDHRGQKLLGGQSGHNRLSTLLEKRFHCYLFNNVPPNALEKEERQQILDVVRKGRGIVIIGKLWPEVEAAGNLTRTQDDFLSGIQGEAYSLSEGRVFRISGPPHLVYEPGWQVKYDHWQAQLGRAVLWGAGHGPTASLKIVTPETPVKRSKLPGNRCSVSWRDAPAPSTLEIRYRRSDGKIVHSVTEELRDSSGMLSCQIPVVREDNYYVEAWITTEEAVVNWATRVIRINAQAGIDSVHLDKDWGETGETLSGSVKLTRPPADSQQLRVEIVDRRDRVLRRIFPEFKGDRADFRVEIKDWLPMLVRVRATLLEGEQQISCGHTYFRVTKRQRDRFHFLVWDYPGGALAPYAEQQLANLGATLQLSGTNPPRIAAAYGMSWVPYTTRILAKHDANGHMKPTCWNSKREIQNYVDDIASQYRESRQHGVFAYSLGDEVDTRGACVHPACIRAYRSYLKQEYGSIKKLNHSWGSRYESFDEVKLLQTGDNDASNALEQGIYPRWYDRQAFKSYNQVQFCERFASAFREMDPKAFTGFEGAGRMRNGDNYDLLVRKLDFWSPYPDPGDEVIRSICPPDFITGNWMGYAKNADSLLRKYWRMILRGKNVVQWWRWDSCGNRGGEFAWHGLLRPDLTPYAAVKELIRDTKIIRNGLGDVLMNSKMQDDDIVILYSQPSAYAARIEPGSSFGRYEDHHAAWHRILREAGFQFRYITGAMLERGGFNADDCKVLILPRCEAISDRGAHIIEKFVRQGGTLIADVRPGIFNGHLKQRKSPTINDLFGVERTSNQTADRVTATLKSQVGGKRFTFGVENVRHEPGLVVTDGKARGQIDGRPALITNDIGKGRCILLNFTLAGHPHLHKSAQAAQFIESLFGAAGVRPRVKLTDKTGKPVRQVEVVRWENDDLQILALSHVLQGVLGGIAPIQTPREGRTVVVELPRARHLYNLRKQSYVGYGRSIEVSVGAARPALLLAASERLPSPHIKTEETTISRGQVAHVTISMPRAQGLHAVNLRALQPDDTVLDWSRKVVLTHSEKQEIALPIAFNDASGKWILRATDLYTGNTDTATMTVK